MHVVYDSVGKTTFLPSLDCLRPRGMMINYGNASGPAPEIAPLLLTQKGSLFLTRPSLAAYIATPEELAWRAGDVLNWIAQGKLKLHIHKVYPLADAAQAHRDLEGRLTERKAAADTVIEFAELKIDALLVSAAPNIRYLSGFTGSNGLLLITPDSQTLFTDPRYTIQSSQECATSKVKIVAKGPLDVAAVGIIGRKRLKRIGFEAGRTTYESYQRLKQALPLAASLKPLAAVIERLRMIKSDEEIARIRRA